MIKCGLADYLTSGIPMHKVEYRTRQARHLLAKLVLDKMPLNRTPCDPEGPTECGWMAAKKAPAKCPGLTSSKATLKVGDNGTVTVKKASKSSTIASLMAGTTQHKKADTRAMYKFPSIDTYDFESSSPEKPTVPEHKNNKSSGSRTGSAQAPCRPTNDVNTSNADLIKTIFGTSSAKNVPLSVTASTATPNIASKASQPAASTTTQPLNSTESTFATPIIASSSYIPAKLPGAPQSPPIVEGYSKSYSWALEDHISFPSFE